MLVERPAVVRHPVPVPRDPVPRQLRGGHDRELLVVRLVQVARSVQQGVGPLAAIARDAREQRQVVVAPGDVDGVELERAEAVDDAQHRRGLGRQRARRREEVARHEEPARDLARDVADGGGGHATDPTWRSCRGVSGLRPRPGAARPRGSPQRAALRARQAPVERRPVERLAFQPERSGPDWNGGRSSWGAPDVTWNGPRANRRRCAPLGTLSDPGRRREGCGWRGRGRATRRAGATARGASRRASLRTAR